MHATVFGGGGGGAHLYMNGGVISLMPYPTFSMFSTGLQSIVNTELARIPHFMAWVDVTLLNQCGCQAVRHVWRQWNWVVSLG